MRNGNIFDFNLSFLGFFKLAVYLEIIMSRKMLFIRFLYEYLDRGRNSLIIELLSLRNASQKLSLFQLISNIGTKFSFSIIC